MKKIILAFSGGLDTSFCIPYLKEKDFEVITVTVNTGGFNQIQLKEIAEKSKKLGAIKHYEIDAQKDLYEKFATYLIKANYQKGGVYPACVGPERIIIAIKIAEIAKKESCKSICHGSTGAGNDQIRFDMALQTLISNCEIISPIREENLTRQKEVEFLKSHGFEVSQSTKDYSINVGLLGITIGGKETKSTLKEIPENIFPNVKSIDQIENEEIFFKITFEKGLPVKLNDENLSGLQIIQKLNQIGALNGFGKDYHIGTTTIGIKGRIAFEAPAMKILIKAHSELEKVILTSKQIFWKNTLGTIYGDLIHDSFYFDPIIQDIEAFLNSASKFVEGEVTIKLQKGILTISSITSKYSLFENSIATYGEENSLWTGIEAKAFCKLYGMESKIAFSKHNQI